MNGQAQVGQPRLMKGLERNIDLLDTAIADLARQIDGLNEQCKILLTPVVGAGGEAPVAQSTAVPACEAACWIEAAAERVTDLTHVVAGIRMRLDV